MFGSLLRQAALGQQPQQMPQQQMGMTGQMQMPGGMGMQQGGMDMFGQSNTPTLSNILRGMKWPGQI